MCDQNNQNNQIIHMKQIQSEGLELFIRKNADYGDSYKQYGLIGVLVRLQDKINRCLNISKNGISVKDESLRDTLIDLHNYAAMALMESDQNLRFRTSLQEPIRTNSSEPPSESDIRVRRSLSDPPLQAMTPAMRASISEMDRCINLR